MLCALCLGWVELQGATGTRTVPCTRENIATEECTARGGRRFRPEIATLASGRRVPCRATASTILMLRALGASNRRDDDDDAHELVIVIVIGGVLSAASVERTPPPPFPSSLGRPITNHQSAATVARRAMLLGKAETWCSEILSNLLWLLCFCK